MSKSPQINNRYVRYIKPDRNINKMKFQEQQGDLNKKSNQKALSRSSNLLKSRSKSANKNNQTSNGKDSSIMQKAYLKKRTLKQQVSDILSFARQTKAKINKGLQFVKLLDNFNQQQRCLQHNNIITLYCLNDKRLLCVYCIYNIQKHRAHKLLPPYQHIQYISNDVYQLQQNFNQYLFSLQQVVLTSKQNSVTFQNIMRKYLSQIQAQYIKRKFQLQKLYQTEKNYILKACQQLIENSKLISTQYEQIKYNIWQCQARYNLDKRLKISYGQKFQNDLKNKNNKLNSMNKELTKQLNKQNKLKQSKILQDNKSNLNKSKSPSKMLKKQIPPVIQKQVVKEQQKLDTAQKDYRQALSKHIILSHVVQQMKKIQPIKFDQITVEKKLFFKSMLKLVSNKNQGYKSHSKQKTKKS